jgi:hypothetical protein
MPDEICDLCLGPMQTVSVVVDGKRQLIRYCRACDTPLRTPEALVVPPELVPGGVRIAK